MSSNSVGYVAEGELTNDGGGWGIQLDDGTWLKLEDVLQRWKGKRIRLLIANLGLIEELADMGMKPGNEQEFVSRLSPDDVARIVGQD